eukprot:scaffold14197_cov15-Tisochrysis_lutea.AAC.1
MQEGSREGQEEAVSLDGGEEHLEWDGGGGIAAEERGPMSMMRLPIEACTEQHLRGLRNLLGSVRCTVISATTMPPLRTRM